MKSYKHLYEELISDENIILAIQNAASGNMKRRRLKEMKANPEAYVETVREWIINFKPAHHKPKIINDGISAKKRSIFVPTLREHIVQHAVMNILKPIFMKGMYEHSYASIPDRGCHKGMRTIRKWIKRRKVELYCLKMDIHHFFESVDNEILLSKLRKLIRDFKMVSLLEKIIGTTKGLPLGFYTSQWFANFYLQELDHRIKEKLKATYYIRYMDDMVIFSYSKKELHILRYLINFHLNTTLNLKLKNNWQVFPLSKRFLDYMGFKFFYTHIALRKTIALKAVRKARRISNKPYPTVHDARQMMTYIGYTKPVDVYCWFKVHILEFVNFRQLRSIISRYDKYHNLKIIL